MWLSKCKQVETGINNRGQDRTVFSEKCKLSFQFRGSPASSPGAHGGSLTAGRVSAEVAWRLARRRARGCVWGCVSPGKVRHACRKSPAPTPGFPRKTDILPLFAFPLIRMGFRGSPVRIRPSDSTSPSRASRLAGSCLTPPHYLNARHRHTSDWRMSRSPGETEESKGLRADA